MKNLLLVALSLFCFETYAQNAVGSTNLQTTQSSNYQSDLQMIFEKRSETIQLLNQVKQDSSLSIKDLKKIQQFSTTLKRLNMLDYTNPKMKKRALKSLAHIDKSLNKMSK